MVLQLCRKQGFEVDGGSLKDELQKNFHSFISADRKKQASKAASSGTEICTRQIGNAPVGVKVFSNPSDAKVKSVSQLKDSRSIFSTGRTVK